jgi:hypothetical protein
VLVVPPVEFDPPVLVVPPVAGVPPVGTVPLYSYAPMSGVLDRVAGLKHFATPPRLAMVV